MAGPNAQITQTQNDLFGIRISAFELHHLFSLLYCAILILRETFFLRQGLWTEGLRTPPGQECSNGSLTFLAVVLWRTFSR
jgi:hypothetical protein